MCLLNIWRPKGIIYRDTMFRFPRSTLHAILHDRAYSNPFSTVALNFLTQVLISWADRLLGKYMGPQIFRIPMDCVAGIVLLSWWQY